MKNHKDLSIQWRSFREKAGLTQKEVSEALGYSTPQFISNVERGRCQFPVEKLPKLKRLYRLSSNQVIDMIMSEQRRDLSKHFKKGGSPRA